MKKYVCMLAILILVACKKEKNSNDFGNTHWNFRYKLNNTFTFFAASNIFLNENKEVINYRFADTILGNWKYENNILQLTFKNGETYTSTYVSRDSLSGVSQVAGNTGEWNAAKK